MGENPEPDHQEWIARMRERARQDAEELVPRPAFAVFGLAAPRLRPVALTEAWQEGDEWQVMGLAYGDWAAPAGPWVSVTTSARSPATNARAELICAIDLERNRLADAAGVDEAEPAGQPEYSQVNVPVDGRNVSGLACRHGTVRAVYLLAGSVQVTVVTRDIEPDSVRLAAIADLEPYLRGRNEMLSQVAERQRSQPPPDLEPAEGMAAYRALVDAELAEHAQLKAAILGGRVPRHRPGDGARIAALWQRAVGELARRASLSQRDADDIVTSVVNQLASLAEKALWFTAEPRLRERAVDETLRHAVLGEAVSSLAAQRAWTGFWEYNTSVAVQATSPPLQPGARLGAELLEERWLEEWRAWTQR